ncbi:hypothetical protein C8A05DRAFT_40336 [Staphylotrichum tortipilum]|uniref:Folliculin-interacting protein N-terminal domain-containing protein n=1 Tax=Staphylotrichum tortipilum TaxID=2831512 RepID=A0AAN6MUK3_9PEZI|nr:hypothetical protein C8A05DRAFT_40336 [Staphylotrichum longicolle]
MLGKLFNLGAGSAAGALPSPQPASRGAFPLESVQEDIHTRHLLFPDPQDLYEHRLNQLYPLSSGATTPTGSSAAFAFDYNADIELDVRDVRIIIMQDALSSVAASLLYDSQPAPPVPSASMDRPSATAGSYSVQEPRRTPASPRHPSISYSQRPIVIQPGSPKIRQGAFDRRPSVHSRNQGYIESEPQRAWREYREELATFSSCIFGNSELMAYKGTSTKVHVVPSDVRQADPASVLGDGRGSLGRSTMRASRLSQSFSSENPPPFPTPPTPGTSRLLQDRKKVLITRLFPVSLPLDDDAPSPHPANSSDETAGYPFPQTATEDARDPKAGKKKPQPRQKRTPMYAVALIITLPPSPPQYSSATTRSGFRGPGSYAEQDSFPSSFSSARRSGWALVGHGADSFDPTYGNDMEDQIDAITQHWDIIMRTLSHLQSVVTATLFSMLRQVDLTSPDPLTAFPLQLARGQQTASGRRSEDGPPIKPPKTNAKHITLIPNCLLDNRSISAEIDAAKSRIVAGIRASRVTTGQNRWPIWREEARWMAKWAGGREQGFFFFNLLTGFLATHTDWLQALSPPAYRRRHLLQQQRGQSEEGTLLPSRTIVLSDDKIAARRLVFLLSAFLPASQQLPGLRAHRPSTPASLSALSQSPPSFVVPILKEESLRRKINRRTGSRMPSHSRNLSLQTYNARAGGVPGPLAHLSMDSRHERRASDAASIRTTHLPIRGSDPNTRKSSAATTATITPETSIPHFSTVHRTEIFAQGRPGNGTSVAADDLKRLARDESPGSQGSASAERRQSSRWSVISGLWSARRRDSTSRSPAPADGQNGIPGSPAKPRQSSITAFPKQAAAIPQGVQSAGGAASGQAGDARDDDVSVSPRDPTPPPPPRDPPVRAEQPGVAQKPQRTPNPSGAFESPVKTSINIDDGVIEVDVPLPDFITSFESAVSSPSSSGYLSASGFGTGLDAFEQAFRFAADGDVPLNVAGWLQHYHPDFVLQALPAQHDIMERIKDSMPLLDGDTAAPSEKWIDIASAIVADATTFTITRLRYRRLIRLRAGTNTAATPAGIPSPHVGSSSSPTAANQPAAAVEVQLKEEFIEEPIVAFDDVLVEAVERVIAAAGTSTESTVSKVSSTSSSRSTSKRRERERSNSFPGGPRSDEGPSPEGSAVHHHHQHQHVLGGPAPPAAAAASLMVAGLQEVPRSQCKTVLLSALEDIIQDVIGEREQVRAAAHGLPGEEEEDLERERERERERQRERERESPLREAVRSWIESVDLIGE